MAFALANGVCGDQGIDQAVERCPFLRNIAKPTVFAWSASSVATPATKGARGPIFEDGPNFDAMFRLFHGRDGVVPLSEGQSRADTFEAPPAAAVKFNPMAACAASMSLSFGSGMGPFNFDSFMANIAHKPVGRKQKPKRRELKPEPSSNSHEMGSEWLSTGNCPIARSYRAVGGLLPLVAKALTLPKNVKYVCPPAIVAARKALAKTTAVKALRPQALPTKVLAIGCLGMMLNIPLGMYREHTVKFSPQWILAVHATVPFIAMLRKAVVMPKYAMAFTIGSAILGQAIGARAERARLLAATKNVNNSAAQGCFTETELAESAPSSVGGGTMTPQPVAVC
ncbi:unnamed protein product [Calypogeia fissa]